MHDGLKDQLDRIERNVEALRGEIRELVSSDVKAGARNEIHNAALTKAVEALTITMHALNESVTSRQRTQWWESTTARVIAVALAVLLVGERLAPYFQKVVSP